jgi:hypothetical protein
MQVANRYKQAKPQELSREPAAVVVGQYNKAMGALHKPAYMPCHATRQRDSNAWLVSIQLMAASQTPSQLVAQV